MKKRITILAAAAAGAALVACSAPSGLREIDGEPYVRGPVESFTHHATSSNLLVRAGPGSREACGISATVDSETRYLRRSGGGALRSAARADVQVGDTVEVYVEGPVMESCPVQGYADVVVLVGE